MQEVLLQHGIWGVVVLGLGIAVISLFKRLQEVTDKRHEDMKTVAEKYHAALNENARTIEELTRVLERRSP